MFRTAHGMKMMIGKIAENEPEMDLFTREDDKRFYSQTRQKFLENRLAEIREFIIEIEAMNENSGI